MLCNISRSNTFTLYVCNMYIMVTRISLIIGRGREVHELKHSSSLLTAGIVQRCGLSSLTQILEAEEQSWSMSVKDGFQQLKKKCLFISTSLYLCVYCLMSTNRITALQFNKQ